MKPIMKKWLTGLLCASLLAGSAPVYGADFSAEADFSSEISVEETQEEDQTEPETHLNRKLRQRLIWNSRMISVHRTVRILRKPRIRMHLPMTSTPMI